MLDPIDYPALRCISLKSILPRLFIFFSFHPYPPDEVYATFPPAHLRPARCSDLRPRRGRRPLQLPERRLRLLVQTGLWTRFRRDLLLPARLDRKPLQRVRLVLSHPRCPASVRGAPFVGPSARVCRPRRAPQSALPRASVGPTARLSRPRRARPSAPPRASVGPAARVRRPLVRV